MNRNNNFDLIRLLAAFQVLISHVNDHFHLGLPLGPIVHFPGVIIFFVISGCLVYASYQRSSPGQFAINRMLRIYPGLWGCLIFTAASMALLGRLTDWTHPKVLMWLAAHATIFQFYDDRYFANWGAGGVSGALWTISVELQFYFFVPVLARILNNRHRDALLLALCVISLGVNIVTAQYLPPDTVVAKLLRISLAPYLFYFCAGIAAYVHWSSWRQYIEGRAAAWAAIYLVYVLLATAAGMRSTYFPNVAQLVGFILLAGVTLSCGFTNPSLSRRLLSGNDLSYGIYLYHMPIIGILIESGMRGTWSGAGMAIALTVAAAFVSWRAIERPALELKLRLRRVAAA